MKNKVLTNSFRTLTSNILILETKQLKTSFWEVRLLYFSFFKKSFLKVTQTLLSFLFFSVNLIDSFETFFPEISSFFQIFLVMLLLLWRRLVVARSIMMGGKMHMRKEVKHAKHTSWKRASYRRNGLSKDSTQICHSVEILEFIPVKRRSHLRVKNQKKDWIFFSFFPSIFGNKRKVKETF